MKLKSSAYVTLDGISFVKISPCEMSLFRILIESKGEIVHNDQIACACFGELATYDGNGIDNGQISAIVNKLRRKLDIVSGRAHIFRDGGGYRMDSEGVEKDG